MTCRDELLLLIFTYTEVYSPCLKKHQEGRIHKQETQRKDASWRFYSHIVCALTVFIVTWWLQSFDKWLSSYFLFWVFSYSEDGRYLIVRTIGALRRFWKQLSSLMRHGSFFLLLCPLAFLVLSDGLPLRGKWRKQTKKERCVLGNRMIRIRWS